MLMESEKTMKAVGLRFLILSLCALLSVIGFEDIASAQTNQGKSASSGAPSNPRSRSRDESRMTTTSLSREPMCSSRGHPSEPPRMWTETIL